MKLETEIKSLQNKLIWKARKKGLYENFGDKEVRDLKDKYGANDKIDEFAKWCRTTDDRTVKNWEG